MLMVDLFGEKIWLLYASNSSLSKSAATSSRRACAPVTARALGEGGSTGPD